MSAELNVQLRLLQDNVAADAKKAADTVGRTMGSSSQQNAHVNAMKAYQRAMIGTQQNAHVQAFKQMQSSMVGLQANSHVQAYKLALKQIVPLQQNAHVMAFRAANKAMVGSQQNAHVQAFKSYQAGLPPILTGGGGGGGASGAGGQSIMAGFHQMVMSYIRFKVFSAAIDMARKALENFAEAIKRAAKRYADAATSGFGVGTFTNRNLTAGILGVSPEEVFRFGNAFAFVGDKMKASLDIIAAGTRPLAETNMSWEMMKVDLEALFVTLALKMRPAIESFISGIDKIITVMTKFSDVIVTVFSPWSMKQLPASAWEKMGLVLGGIGSSNYAAQTAEATRKSARFLEMMAKNRFTSADLLTPISATP